MRKLDRITRVEVIDEAGRSYVNWDKDNKVNVSFQDGGRTMKIFIAKQVKSKIGNDQSAADDYLDHLSDQRSEERRVG